MSNYSRKKSFYAGYLAKFMFTKHCRSHNLDPTREFFKHAGTLYHADNTEKHTFFNGGDDDDDNVDSGDGDKDSSDDDDDSDDGDDDSGDGQDK